MVSNGFQAYFCSWPEHSPNKFSKTQYQFAGVRFQISLHGFFFSGNVKQCQAMSSRTLRISSLFARFAICS
ncbi:hypothetical protein MSVAZ_2501 [Methanosarcina vacuolata Z-761]|uniref:Uncharacterized protein n=1 Tax=Methanosarcina vacuolata Z-761 TaxID=1434123 RepID=A0A0E3Q5I1_9EURY|nr:hypothetical protein MSVAZ_2501 [Methanosarcina vacuolata Z-761]